MLPHPAAKKLTDAAHKSTGPTRRDALTAIPSALVNRSDQNG